MARRRVAVEETEQTKEEIQEEKPSEFSQQLTTEKEWVEARNAANETHANGGVVKRLFAKTVRVVWGQETFSPTKFHVCVVGPFELEAAVPEGEDAFHVICRLREELSKMAEFERERKLKSFIPNCTVQKG
jgi:hypothetical protein